MENLKLGIERDKGILTDFLFDAYIIDGLFFTHEIDKVKSNCANFDIKIEKSVDSRPMNTLISRFDNVVIITNYIDDENQAQYLIGDDLSIKELAELPESDFMLNPKSLIAEAFCLLGGDIH